DEAEALGVVEPLHGAGLTIRHGVTPWISLRMHGPRCAVPDCIEQGVTRSDVADRLERPSPTLEPVIYRIGATMYRDPALNSGRTIQHFRANATTGATPDGGRCGSFIHNRGGRSSPRGLRRP